MATRKKTTTPYIDDAMVAKLDEQQKKITDAIVKAMGSGYNWVKEWGACISGPMSGTTGKRYSGRNRFALGAMQAIIGSDDPRWYTAKHVEKMGWTLHDDATEAYIEKWKRISGRKPVTDPDGKPVTDDDGKQKWQTFYYMRLVGGWTVYNAAEIDGCPEYDKPEAVAKPADLASNLADKLIETSRCPVAETDSEEAYYDPIVDRVVVPRREQFKANEGFLRTLLHEMVHSTARVCRRPEGGHFGSPEYAFEELIAELGSAFAADDLGFPITDENFALDESSEYARNHTAYLESWLRALADKPDYIYKAASKASQAVYRIEADLEEAAEEM